jgi:hypothetical protein
MVLKTVYFILSCLAIYSMTIVEIPNAEINNGLIQAKLYLPDQPHGYYQGTRFDWSGNISSLTYNGHKYFGRWFTSGDPEVHDTIMGPVEEFAPLDYEATKPGAGFVKIGIGTLLKPDNKAYSSGRPLSVLNHGIWKINKQPDEVRFIHELRDENYSYNYQKTVQLIKDKPQLVLSHTLTNTGKRTIETNVYSHNFFVIDNQATGSGFSVKFPFTISGEGIGSGELTDIKDNKIVFLRNLKSGETVYYGDLTGYTDSSKDFNICIENRITRAGVRITSDQPICKLVFWACSTTLCPEPYIKLKIEPGEEITWKINYEFYYF